MKKTITILVIIGLIVTGRFFYQSYKQQLYFKRALLYELKNGISILDHKLVSIDKNINEVDLLKEKSQNSIEINEWSLSSIQTDLNWLHTNLTTVSHPEDCTWKSLQQKDALTHYTLYELENLNQAYNHRKILLETQKDIKSFTNFIPLYLQNIHSKSTKEKHLELYRFYTDYTMKLTTYRSQIDRTIWYYSIAIEKIDPENAFLKTRDSIHKIK